MTTSTSEIEVAVQQLIVDLFLFGDTSFPLTPEMDLLEAGVFDSLGFIQLAAELEQRFDGLSVSDEDIGPEQMSRIGDLALLVLNGDGSL
jgi:acyl carrier protein